MKILINDLFLIKKYNIENMFFYQILKLFHTLMNLIQNHYNLNYYLHYHLLLHYYYHFLLYYIENYY